MKKIKMTLAAAMLCAIAFAGYTAYNTATMTDAERMLQANVEALASSESGSNANRNPNYYTGYGGYYCCDNQALAYCPYVDCNQY